MYQTINGLSGFPPADSLMTLAADGLPVVLVLVLAGLFVIPWRRDRLARRCGAVTAALATALALLLNQAISRAVGRVRPYMAHPLHAHLLVARSHDPSFPSDHATAGFAVGVAILFYDRAVGVFLLLLAGVLAFARVYVGMHYPGDVLGGALIGSAVALVLRAPVVRGRLEGLARSSSEVWEHGLRTLGIEK